MNTYERLLSSLVTEFKQKAPSQFRSLWADLMELEDATDERMFSVAHDQALRRTRALGCAAKAAGAHPVPSLSRSLELKLCSLTRADAGTHPESIETVHRTMNQLAEALYLIDATARAPENANQPTETLLVESCTD
jgi:hypothetical protein